MLQLDLYRVFENKGIENPHQFMRKNGLTTHVTSRLLNNNVSSISYKHLELLCLMLNCTVDDLFNWKTEDKAGMYKDHALQKLKRGQRSGNITRKIIDLPPEKLNELMDFIDQLSTPQK